MFTQSSRLVVDSERGRVGSVDGGQKPSQSLFRGFSCSGGPQLPVQAERPFFLGVDLDGTCADYYGGLRPIAAEWLGVDVARLTRRTPVAPRAVSPDSVCWRPADDGIVRR